ncbi:antibiotic biosynthesis monooxygenase [Cycloclasticus sp. P1]|uniref:antibiotic biosynthesis monooxygenase n=1 Tax=Cycloclasticus sp. (strain P1) TaxID=385025 RepID=UPI000286AAD5|nr:antibiotic biosynthesis monooxygenase [Cycloclasticus sp. P1]AFT66231.1 Antibiotic biosynthesis monooxygenase [Cycloclasticus sp. P1]
MADTDNTAVTVSIARKVKKGAEQQYEDWLHRLSEVATKFPGHQGVHILKPSAQTGGDYVLIVGFNSYAHQKKWEESEQRQRFLDELDEKGLIEGSTKIKKVSGLEFWFTLPEVPSSAPPNRHKMALVLMVVVFSLLVTINQVFAPWLSTLTPILKLAIMVVGQVLLMTYLVMPAVTRLLKNWLYR